MDSIAIKERLKAFHQRHGESFSDGSFFYFADGSWRDIDPFGVLVDCENYDPAKPEHEYQLALNKMKFAELRYKLAVRDFDGLNTRLAQTLPSNAEEELARLRRFGKLVEAARADLNKAQEVLESTLWGRARRAQREAKEEQLRRFAEFQRQRKAIRV